MTFSVSLKFENRVDTAVGHTYSDLEYHVKCKCASEFIPLIVVTNLCPFKVVQKYQYYQLCVLPENSIVWFDWKFRVTVVWLYQILVYVSRGLVNWLTVCHLHSGTWLKYRFIIYSSPPRGFRKVMFSVVFVCQSFWFVYKGSLCKLHLPHHPGVPTPNPSPGSLIIQGTTNPNHAHTCSNFFNLDFTV